MKLTVSIKAARGEPSSNGKQVVGFEVRLEGVKSVWLLGIVGAWHPSFFKMKEHSQGLWIRKIELPPGDFSYRLIADGSWIDTAATLKTDYAPCGTITRFFTIPDRLAFSTKET